MIVLNSLEDKDSGFGVDTNKVTIVDSSGEMLRLPVKPKKMWRWILWIMLF